MPRLCLAGGAVVFSWAGSASSLLVFPPLRVKVDLAACAKLDRLDSAAYSIYTDVKSHATPARHAIISAYRFNSAPRGLLGSGPCCGAVPGWGL